MIELQEWNQMITQTKEVVGSVTMAINIILTILNNIISLLWGVNSTSELGLFVNEVSMFMTIALWNISNQDVFNFSRNWLKKPWS